MPRLQSLDLTFIEPTAHARRNFPVSVGVPFAKGAMKVGTPVAIHDAAGKSQPIQTRVMETHEDGSVRWMLVDYLADSEPLALSTSTLRFGKKPAETPADIRITTREEGDLLVVENGPLKMELYRRRCVPLQRVWQEGKLVSEGGPAFDIIAEDGGTFSAAYDAEARFEIEESGPLRLLVRWEGTHKDASGNKHFDFLVRMTIYAGQPFVRIDYTFFNRFDALNTNVRQITARVPLALEGPRAHHVADHDMYQQRRVDVAGPARLEAMELHRFRILNEQGQVLKQIRMGNFNHQTNGWAAVSANNRSVLVAGKWFWQNYPKAMNTHDDSIEYHLVPQREKPFAVTRGMAKTHTMFVGFHHGAIGDASRPLEEAGGSLGTGDPLAVMASRVQRWPQPTPDSLYYQQSGEVWDFFPHYPGMYPQVETSLRYFFSTDTTAIQDPPIDRAYGLKHYGDHVHGHGTDAPLHGPMVNGPDPDAQTTYYLNNEYDTPHVLAMMFMRTRQIAEWWGAEAHALHMMDIDTNHCPIAPPRNDHLHDGRCLIDCQYRHAYQHIGGIQTPDETRFIPAEGSHTFAEGLLDLYHMTGDRRALDTVCAYADHLAYMVNDRGYKWGLGRGSGWGILVLAGAWDVRRKESWKRAIQTLVQSAEEDTRVRSDRYITLATRGVIKWHQVSGDPVSRKVLLRLTDELINSFGPDGVPLYSAWPEINKPSTEVSGFANLELLAYAYDLTGDRKYIDTGLGLLNRAVNWLLHPTFDKGLMLWMRILRGPFRFMAIAHDLGLLERVPGAGGWIAQAPARTPRRAKVKRAKPLVRAVKAKTRNNKAGSRKTRGVRQKSRR